MGDNTGNECGNCTACCLTHAVHRTKPAGIWCQFCDQHQGCIIYDRRPKDCRDFLCEWRKVTRDDALRDRASLTGWRKIFGAEPMRPDRLGVVFDFCTVGVALKKQLQFWEARTGALANPLVWDITREILAQQIPVLHLCLSGKKILFMPDGMGLAQEVRDCFVSEGFEITTYPILG